MANKIHPGKQIVSDIILIRNQCILIFQQPTNLQQRLLTFFTIPTLLIGHQFDGLKSIVPFQMARRYEEIDL